MTVVKFLLFFDDRDHIGRDDDVLGVPFRIQKDDEFAVTRIFDEIGLHRPAGVRV